jgi:hypothetical protein
MIDVQTSNVKLEILSIRRTVSCRCWWLVGGTMMWLITILFSNIYIYITLYVHYVMIAMIDMIA